MSTNLQEQLAVLPDNLSSHLLLSVVALAIGLSVSLPLALIVETKPRLRSASLAMVSVVQTIPSLALLALMVPLLTGISLITADTLGITFSALGFAPAVIALALYSMLPIVRNTITGLAQVDSAVIEAAQGVGMTPNQLLWKIKLPLAAPVIMAGIRTATVWVIGTATLATPVGQRSLGNYIFSGLQTRNWTAVLIGCLAAASLAISLDTLIGGIERGLLKRKRSLVFVSVAGILLIVVLGLMAPPIARHYRSVSIVESGRQARTVRVGAKTFTEQYILAELMGKLLNEAGFDVQTKAGLGSAVIFDALVHGEIDVYVGYTGTIWANHMKRDSLSDPSAVLTQMSQWLHQTHGIACLGSLGFENAYGLAMLRDRALSLGVDHINDLRELAPTLRIGGDYEFFDRPEWRAIRDGYALRFAEQISYDSTFMYEALLRHNVDVISAFTSDGRIAAYDLKVLDDPFGAIPPYDAVLLLSPKASQDQAMIDALGQLISAIDVTTMQQANFMVDREENKSTVPQAANWLFSQLKRNH